MIKLRREANALKAAEAQQASEKAEVQRQLEVARRKREKGEQRALQRADAAAENARRLELVRKEADSVTCCPGIDLPIIIGCRRPGRRLVPHAWLKPPISTRQRSSCC
jgi:hypothetical protein